jgi:hypothetical protein
MALSPARTRSITTIAASADRNSGDTSISIPFSFLRSVGSDLREEK